MTIRRKHISFKNNERDDKLFKFLERMSEIYGFSSYIKNLVEKDMIERGEDNDTFKSK